MHTGRQGRQPIQASARNTTPASGRSLVFVKNFTTLKNSYTVELLEQALDVAERLGYTVRQEWLAGIGGGGCELKGHKLFFLDLDLGPAEQLEQVVAALRHEPDAIQFAMPGELQELLKVRKTA